ncbi:MAG: S8 family serine peptidase [Chitinophagales bacterium]
MVKFKAGVASTQAETTMQSMDAQIVENYEGLSIQQWTLPNAVSIDGQNFTANNVTNVEDLAAYLMANNPNIEFAEPNYIMSASPTDFIPNDPSLSLLWGLNNTGQTGGIADADIDAFEAWATTKGDNDIIVGVLDSGIDWTHPDLAENIWQNLGEDADGDGVTMEKIDGVWQLDPGDDNGIDDDGNGYPDDLIGWDFVDNDNEPEDGKSHGTHVAGSIAALENGEGIVGVSPQVRIMVLRFLNNDGLGAVSDAIRGLNYAMSKGAHLTNNSWGGTGLSQSLQDAISQAADANQLFIAAAGNNATDNDVTPYYPSGYDLDNIIAVAASDQSDQLAGFSNYGATSVDIAAPGVSIFSTLPEGTYGSGQGTSMATPHVTGTAVLLWSMDLTADYSTIKNAILSSVDVVGSLEGLVATGGRMNSNGALLALAECTTEANFNGPSGVVCPGTLQNFENTSLGGETNSYGWYLADTLYTTDENAKITFTEPGEHMVKLVATGDEVDCVSEISIPVFVSGPADADFTYSTGSLAVTFDAVEVVEGYSYQWTFGDESDNSIEANPVHEYALAGSYEVTLAITNLCSETTFMTKTVVVEVAELPNCPIAEDFTAIDETLMTCNNGDGNVITLPTLEIGGEFGANAVAVWAQDETDAIQVSIGENNEVTLEQQADCEVGEYHFYLSISCTEDETVTLDGGHIAAFVYAMPQAPTLIRNDDACNYSVVTACEFDTASPETIFVEQGGEAGTVDISISNGACIEEVYTVEYEACPVVVVEGCPEAGDVSPTSIEMEGCSNIITLPFVAIEGDNVDNSILMWSIIGNPDFEIPLGQSPTVELPANMDCDAQVLVFRLDIACTTDETVFLDGGTLQYTLHPEPQAPTIERVDDECNYTVVPHCDNDILSMNPADLVQMPGTDAGEVIVEVSNEGCSNPYQFSVAFEECPQVCPEQEEVIVGEEVHEHLCNSDEGNIITLSSTTEVIGDAVENAVFAWRQVENGAPTVAVAEGATPIVQLSQNTECGAVIYEFELFIQCTKDENISWYGGAASYEVYPQPQEPMIEMTQDEATGVCAYAVLPYCEGDVVSPEALDEQTHNTPEGLVAFEVSNEGCAIATFEVVMPECPTVCVLEGEFEVIELEESLCNNDSEEGNSVTLPASNLESENAETAVYTWTQIENGAPMVEVAAGAEPMISLEQNTECDAVSYEFALTITCSKDSTISYNGGMAVFHIFPTPQAPIIERVDGEEEAEVCAYQVIAACDSDGLSEAEFTQENGSGENIREITVNNGGWEPTFEVPFEKCPALPCAWMIAENTVKCNAPSYTMCVEAVDTLKDVIGLNFKVRYPEGTSLVEATPTTYFKLSDDLVSDVNNLASFSNVNPDGSLNVVIYVNNMAEGMINGAGTLGCVEFYFDEELHNAWPEATFSIEDFQEGYLLESKDKCVDDGLLIIDFDPGHELAFMVNGDETRPLTDDVNSPITSVYTADEECITSSDENALLDENGAAIIGSSDKFRVARWVGCEPLNPVVTGEDALLTAKIVVRDTTDGYIPSIYALVAADVNDNGTVDGADISLILARSVGSLCHYPVQADKDTSDWKFERYEVTMEDPAWAVDANYPYGSGEGADASNVPLASQCHYTPEPLGDTCAYTFSNYVAILKGDVDDSWNQDAAMIAEAPGKLVIDLENMLASANDDKFYIPVTYNGNEPINAVDFRLSVDAQKLDIEEVRLASNNNGLKINYAWNKHNNQEILLSAYTLEGQINAGKPVFYLVTSTSPNAISPNSIQAATSILNGLPSNIEVVGEEVHTDIDNVAKENHQLRAYPNPANHALTLDFSSEMNVESVTYTVYDFTGKQIQQYMTTTNAPYQVKTNEWIAGTYLITVQDSQDGQFLAREKVLIVH